MSSTPAPAATGRADPSDSASAVSDASSVAGSGAPLPEGPRWYRRRIRTWGPFVALVAPAVLGAVAWMSLRLFDTAWSGAVGLIGGVLAAPGLLAAGAPFGDNDVYPFAVAASAVMWVLIGFVASRRATRNPMATWNDYFRHLAWLTAGVWIGAGAALGIAAVSISDSLL